MNKIKSIFIGIFPMFAMTAAGLGTYMLTVPGNNLIWLGVVMVTLPVMVFIGRIMMFKNVARTSAHFPILTTLAFAGLATSLYGYATSALTSQSGLALGTAVVGCTYFILFGTPHWGAAATPDWRSDGICRNSP